MEGKHEKLTTRTHDCVAESPEQLMYIAGDTLILLRELEDDEEGGRVLGACEGVVGWIRKGDIDFSSSVSRPDPIAAALVRDDNLNRIPDTIISSPTPPTRTIDLPSTTLSNSESASTSTSTTSTTTTTTEEGGLEADNSTPRLDGKRASGPFDLGTPNYSPALEGRTEFFESAPTNSESFADNLEQTPTPGQEGRKERVRDSITSNASSDAYGGIGGFMMGVSGAGGDDSMRSGVEEMKGMSCHVLTNEK
jgi:hypothetical protein